MAVQSFKSIFVQPLFPTVCIIMGLQCDFSPFNRSKRHIGMIAMVVDLCFASQLSEHGKRLVCIDIIFSMKALPFL